MHDPTNKYSYHFSRLSSHSYCLLWWNIKPSYLYILYAQLNWTYFIRWPISFVRKYVEFAGKFVQVSIYTLLLCSPGFYYLTLYLSHFTSLIFFPDFGLQKSKSFYTRRIYPANLLFCLGFLCPKYWIPLYVNIHRELAASCSQDSHK